MSFTNRATGLASLLKGPFERLGHNWDDPKRVDPAVDQKLSFKAKPKPTVVSACQLYPLYFSVNLTVMARAWPLTTFIGSLF